MLPLVRSSSPRARSNGFVLYHPCAYFGAEETLSYPRFVFSSGSFAWFIVVLLNSSAFAQRSAVGWAALYRYCGNNYARFFAAPVLWFSSRRYACVRFLRPLCTHALCGGQRLARQAREKTSVSFLSEELLRNDVV